MSEPFFWYQRTGKTKGGAPLEAKGNWGLTGGGGKLKGIRGKGTYHCTPSHDGYSCEVEYQLTKWPRPRSSSRTASSKSARTGAHIPCLVLFV